eukprot:12723887-Prorocentrum_lima.AAC.1
MSASMDVVALVASAHAASSRRLRAALQPHCAGLTVASRMAHQLLEVIDAGYSITKHITTFN